MAKPKFDPSQPFDQVKEDKPAFDASQPFQRMDEAPQEQSLLQQAGHSAVDSLPLLGGIAGGILGTPADALVGPAGTLTGAGIGGYLGTSAKNLINSYISPEQAPKTTSEAILSPVVGGAEQAGYAAGGELINPLITGPAGKALKGLAESKAVQAVGATGKQALKFASDAGRQLLDRGIVKFGNNQAQIAQNAANAIEQSGNAIGDTLSQLDQQGVKVDRNTVIEYLKNKMAKLAGNEGNKPLSKQLNNRISDIEEEIANQSQKVKIPLMGDNPEATDLAYKYGKPTTQSTTMQPPNPINPGTFANESKFSNLQSLGEELSQRNSRAASANFEQANAAGYDPYNPNVSFEVSPIEKTGMIENSEVPIGKAEEIKRAFDQNGKWGSNSDAATILSNRDAANAYRQASEDAALAANPQLADEFKEAKDTYALLNPIADAAEKRASTVANSPNGGLLDTAAAGAGALIAGKGGAIVAPSLRKVIGTRASSSIATGADWLANVVRYNPTALGKWAKFLVPAANRGSDAIATTDYILQQTDPEYRDHLRGIKDVQEFQENSKVNRSPNNGVEQ